MKPETKHNNLYQQDALGSVIALTDENANVKTTYSYDPFGNTTVTGEVSDNPFQFAGRENDNTGLLYERFRYYSFEVQRYISEDPIGLAGGDVNYFVRVGNNPVNWIDPLGLTFTSNWNFFWDWALGNHNNYHRFYGPNTVETQEMQNSVGLNNLRERFYKEGCKSFSRGEYGTGEAYWDTIANPLTADWLDTSAQVGGFGGANVINNGNGTATFTIKNTAGMYSFFLHLVPNNIFGSTGPMGNIYQTFQWTESVDKSKCKCR